MSKIFSYYHNDVDKAWFNSSNIKYAECDDKDNSLKTVRIVFNTGVMYEYNDVMVQDYLLFRDAQSQGKAFNEYIRKYEAKKLGKVELSKLEEELAFRSEKSYILNYNENSFEITNQVEEKVYRWEHSLSDSEKSLVEGILTALGIVYKHE